MQDDKVNDMDFNPVVDESKEAVTPKHPTHLDCLADVVAQHVVISNGSFGDETARQQIAQALRIAGKTIEEKSFVGMINRDVKKMGSNLRLDLTGSILVLTSSESVTPMDSITLVRKKSAVKPQGSIEFAKPVDLMEQVDADRNWWDSNFR